MSISEEQLEIWSHQGAIAKSKDTADSVKNALNNYEHFPTSDYKVYLQGSYKNDTNIRGESDVDVVIQLNKTFFNNLNHEQKKVLNLYPAEYHHDEYRKDVIHALQEYFGEQNVSVESKCIKIKANDSRLTADVIVACQHREYYALEENSYIEGVHFFTNDSPNRQIINYPDLVYDNGCQKSKDTNGMFKPVVRIFKNLRRQANAKGPSYYIQCLIYNIPNSLFENTYFKCVYNILEHIRLLPDESLKQFLCQHEQFNLFGESEEQWDIQSARNFNADIITFWNNYNN
ncbi:MAG: nucleotidyltransferase [Ignavibacteria bacterium]